MNKPAYIKSSSILEINTQLKTSDLRFRVQENLDRLESNLLPKDIELWEKVKKELINDSSPWPTQQHILMEASRQKDEFLVRYLCARFRYDFFPKLKELGEYPPCVQIEPTSICNFRCVFCFQTDQKLTKPAEKHMGQMSLDMFKTIIDQLEGNVEFVTLASRGEPLLNRKLPEMLDYAKGKFLGFKINTNASHLNEANARMILESDISTLVFSADAGEKEVYESLRINGDFDKVMENIKNFNKLKVHEYPESRLLTRVSGVLFDKIKQDLDTHRNAWKDVVDQVAFVNYLPWENPYESDSNDIQDACSDLWRRMFIWWDGKANPCDVDYLSWLSVGSVNNHSISELWQSKGYESLRSLHTSGSRMEKVPCKSCFVT